MNKSIIKVYKSALLNKIRWCPHKIPCYYGVPYTVHYAKIIYL